MTPQRVIELLENVYKPSKTPLNYDDEWQLLVAIILSAQCTDARVNLVTPNLFKKLPTMQAMADAPLKLIETLIGSVTYYQAKSKYLKTAAQKILNDFNGKLPDTLEKLITIPGVGRKTANVFLHVIHEKAEGVVVDTHIFRVSKRTGTSKGNVPEQVERDIMKKLPQSQWRTYSDMTIQHGRTICHAIKPQCDACPLNSECPSAFQFPHFQKP